MYKKILVPTDFSRPALAAGDLAVELASLFNAEVHFFHKLHLPPKWDEYDEKTQARFPDTLYALRYMENNFKVLRERYAEQAVRISTTYSGGDMVPTISRYIDEEDVYMIIMGSHGRAGLEEIVFGSNAQKVVRNAHCPVLVMKQPVEEANFKNVVFASDFRDEAREPFKRMLDFARRFNSHIHLLHIAAYPRFEASPEDIARMEDFAKDCPLAYTIHGVGDVEVDEGIKFFAKKIKADLVSITHYGGTQLKRIFAGSVSETLVNNIDCPLLVLNTDQTRSTEGEIEASDQKSLWNFAAP